MTDREALSAYAHHHSQDAFRELVERHIAMVYAAARRQLRDPQAADDATQAVFIVLARKAPTLIHTTVLAGWLLRTTHWICRQARRTENRRRIHERRAAEMRSQIDELSTAAASQAWLPLLDDAMARLGQHESDILALRYFQNRTANEIGTALGISPGAVQKRIERALERLRKKLETGGGGGGAAAFMLTGTTLDAQMSALPTTSPPPALVQSAIHAGDTATAATGTAAALAKAALNAAQWLHLELAAACLALAVFAATGVWIGQRTATTPPAPTLAAAPDAASTSAPAPQVVRLIFNPNPDNPTGAFGSRLGPLQGLPGATFMQAHFTLGSTFPVAEPDGTTVFNIRLLDGNDDHLIVNVSTPTEAQQLDLPRDKSIPLKIAAKSFNIVYPTVTTAPPADPVTDKAMILVTVVP